MPRYGEQRKMMQTQGSARFETGKTPWQIALLWVLLVLFPGWAAAVSVNGLYTATVRVADRSEAARSVALADALNVVLAKVSGRLDAASKLGAALGNPARLVQRSGYVTGGQLEVGFDSEAINALLDRGGLPLWDRERPNTLVVYPAALQGLREARAATELAAKNRGLPLVWANAEASEQYPASALTQIAALGQRYEADAVLLARMTGSEQSAANLRWQVVFRGASQEAGGGAETGPGLAAEQISRYYAVSSKEAIRLVMDVSGVDSIDAYANTLNYLGGLLLVRGVAVEALQGGTLRLLVDLRGTAETLQRVLAVDQRLSAQESTVAEAGATLSYRYNR